MDSDSNGSDVRLSDMFPFSRTNSMKDKDDANTAKANRQCQGPVTSANKKGKQPVRRDSEFESTDDGPPPDLLVSSGQHAMLKGLNEFAETDVDEKLERVQVTILKFRLKMKGNRVAWIDHNKLMQAFGGYELKGNDLDQEPALDPIESHELRKRKAKYLKAVGYDKLRSDYNALVSGNRWQNLDLDKAADIDYERAVWIDKYVTTKTWWDTKPGHEVLVLQGRERSDKDLSPVTLWSNAVVQFPWDRKKCLCLYWFCGQFPEWDIRHATLFLLGQLLLFGSPALQVPDSESSPPPKGKWPHERAFVYPELAKTFLSCIEQQLRYTNIIVIIDSISIYQDRGRGRNTKQFFDGLANLAKPSWDGRPRIIVTSPTTTQIAHTVREATEVPVATRAEYKARYI